MKGILVGADQQAEWLLPWWWKNYSAHNDYPVAFADFGMSPTARRWCTQRGVVFNPLKGPPILMQLSEETKALWESHFGDGIWKFRPSWFQKPFACHKSPFNSTCWIDLDCEVRGSLAPLFESLSYVDIALARDPDHLPKNQLIDPTFSFDEICYNSGVIAFQTHANILQQWVDLVERENNLFLGDQNALSRAIYLHRPVLLELSSYYNWFRYHGENPKALIVHYLSKSKLELLLTATNHPL